MCDSALYYFLLKISARWLFLYGKGYSHMSVRPAYHHPSVATDPIFYSS